MKIFFCIIFIASFYFSHCQNILIEFQVNASSQEFKSELSINDSMSIWKVGIDPSSLAEASFLIKSYTQNCVYSNEKLFNLVFHVKDSLHSMKWILTNDTSTILNEKCFSAKTYFRGRSYTAFYSVNYPISNGPWKFGGLPGLILEVKSDDNYVSWTADKIIKNYSKENEIQKIGNYKFMDWKEYTHKYIDAIDRWTKLARSNGTLDENSKGKIKIDAVEIIYPKVQQGDGLSF